MLVLSFSHQANDIVLDVDMSDANANSPTTNPDLQQDLIDRIAQLEHRLQKAQTSIDTYQNERTELLDTIIQLRIRLQNIVDILNK